MSAEVEEGLGGGGDGEAVDRLDVLAPPVAMHTDARARTAGAEGEAAGSARSESA